MIYSRHTTKNSIGKRVFCWILVALLFGMWLGAAIMFHAACPEPVITMGEYIDKAPMYGAFEGVSIPPDWKLTVNRYDFHPNSDVPLDAEVQEFLYCLSAAYEIDSTLVLALIETESNFNPNLVSATNDYGLMQINRCNERYLNEQVGVDNLLNPYDNIKGGLYILRGLFEKYGDTAKVLMAYNMGEGGAVRLWEQGIFEINYSRNVLQSQERFNELFKHIEDGGIYHD